MKQIEITGQTEGKNLLRQLSCILPEASVSFLHKMLRKKNITLNDGKADGSEKLVSGDIIKIYFSDETFDKFAGSSGKEAVVAQPVPKLSAECIIYEDDDIILVNKPCGILSQKAEAYGYSMVEMIAEYIKAKEVRSENFESCKNASGVSESLRSDIADTGTDGADTGTGDAVATTDIKNAEFKPAVTNRLDRNTSGIVAAGKTAKGLQWLSEGFKKREFDKFYLCPVVGRIDKPTLYNGLWSKDNHGNKVKIKDVGWKEEDGRSFPKEYFVKGNVPVQTAIYPIKCNGDCTLLKVELLTGKTHQIRAQLAEAGHPLIGDYKYGNRQVNDTFKKKYGIEYQLLHAYMLNLPGRGMFFADIPESFKVFLQGEDLWEPGIQEVFADQHLRI